MSQSSFCLVKSSINIDETFSVPHIVAPGETISSLAMTSRPGGKGTNVAAAIGLAGASVALSSAVGSDATWPISELEKRNVNVSAIQILPNHPTGRAFIQIAQDGENSIVLLKGANYASTESNDPKVVFSSLRDQSTPVTHLMVQNEIPLNITIDFLEHAHQSGVTTIWNPSPMPTSDQLVSSLPLWNCIDVLIVNSVEARQLVGCLSSSSSNPVEIETDLEALQLLSKLVPSSIGWIVVTRGSKGVVAFVDQQIISVDPFSPRQLKDTTGAGDTFAGYLVAGLMKSSSPNNAFSILQKACLAASIACESEGAMNSIPHHSIVDERFPST